MIGAVIVINGLFVVVVVFIRLIETQGCARIPSLLTSFEQCVDSLFKRGLYVRDDAGSCHFP